MAGVLASLTLTDAAPVRILDKATSIRQRFIEAVRVQMAGAEAMAKGESFVLRKPRYVLDPETKTKVQRDMPVRFRPWYFRSADGQWCTRILYGNKPLEIAKGKTTIQAGTKPEQLVAVYEKVIKAAEGLEFDKQLAGAATRPGRG